MRIAIIGSGISGLALGHYLCREFPQLVDPQSDKFGLTLFESRNYAGGHTRTIPVANEGSTVNIDMGFIVFNQRTYPNFCELLEHIGVVSHPTKMSFSVSCQNSGLEYRGVDLNGLFAQRSNAFNLKFLKMLVDWQRFNRLSDRVLTSANHFQTVKEFFAEHSFGQYFKHKYFYPMGSAVWSAPKNQFDEFPIRFVIEFYKNHGLLGFDLPEWRVITNGSQSYVPPLIKTFDKQIKLETPVFNVRNGPEDVTINYQGGSETFDHVIFACHSDQALRLLGDHATETQAEILNAFQYESNVVTLHSDTTLMPANRRAWACWNYHLQANESDKATLTYYMNELQGLNSVRSYLVSLNREKVIAPEKIIDQVDFSHPLFSGSRHEAQSRHHELINRDRMSFCGAYWGNGFHEDGVNSALKVFRQLKPEIANAQLHLRRSSSASTV